VNNDFLYLKSVVLGLEEANVCGDVGQTLYPLFLTVNDLTGDVIARVIFSDKVGETVATISSLDVTSERAALSLVDFSALAYSAEHNIVTLRCYPAAGTPYLFLM